MFRRTFLQSIIIPPIFYLINTTKANAANYKQIDIGKKALDFQLDGFNINQPNKNTWSLDDFKGKWLVLYFYPKDFTTGCTIEARGFQSMKDRYKKLNAEIVGISSDSSDNHESFCNSENLGYTLLSDISKQTTKEYDSWEGRSSQRNTFLIDTKGIVRYKWINVRPLKHAEDVYEKLKLLQS